MTAATSMSPSPTGRAGLPEAVHAEWVKLRSLRSSIYSALAVIGLTVLFSAFACAAVSTQGGSPEDPGDTDVVMLSLSGVYLSQIAIVALAVTAVTAEYATGMVRLTFVANPRRRTVLAAKTLVVAAVALGVGLAASLLSFLVGQAILPGRGFVAANGYPPVSLGDGPALRAVAGSGIYLAVLGVLGLAAGVILRHTAAAVTTVLGLLYVPLVALTFLPEHVAAAVQRYAPMTAGLAVQVTTPAFELIAGRHTQPLNPWAGLGIAAAYAATALLLAGWLITRRDA